MSVRRQKITPAVSEAPRQRIAIYYVRGSSTKEEMYHSMAAQVSYFTKLIQNDPSLAFGGGYVDEGQSGTKRDRPAFQRMLTTCRAGKADLILTKSISRFARNTLVLLETIRELKALGIEVYFEQERISSLGTEGELMLTVLAALAQDESRAVSENMLWRVRQKFTNGYATHNGILGYRLVDGIYEIVPDEAAIVKLIFSSYLRGLGCYAIVNLLNDLGFVSRFGSPWTKSAVHFILRNEKYTGKLILQKYYTLDHISKKTPKNNGELPRYTVNNAHKVIIPMAAYERVQEEMKRRQEYYFPDDAPAKQPYPFSSLMQCACCGKNYRRKIAGSGKYKRAVWICNTYNLQGKKACASQQIPERILHEKTMETLEIPGINTENVTQQIKQIIVHNGGLLVFMLHSVETVEVHWENRSRRESWDEESRALAREREINRRIVP